MEPGDKVIAVKDIGGLTRDFVPKGSAGVVVSNEWGSIRVRFTVDGVFGAKQVETSVEKNEVA
jgi:hypothetical protein